jgi:hypothetical protein
MAMAARKSHMSTVRRPAATIEHAARSESRAYASAERFRESAIVDSAIDAHMQHGAAVDAAVKASPGTTPSLFGSDLEVGLPCIEPQFPSSR